ncbi:hypothetical protein BU17DRAFT_71157 [Hysterangium stoloniferum]|nr:hypothetical protein BU17DRAFT_71157 [Hysterangium stoloniferum]
MDWEDCVVDVHSIKISGMTLETMFKSCGPVRSVFHWKGQGEKPHIFFEYRSPAAADLARTIGLDRSDLQVIKISNNDMLKRKFRELAHGPIQDPDQRCRPTSTDVTSGSMQTHCDRNEDRNASSKEARLPNKPADVVCYVQGRDVWSKRLDHHPEGSKPEKRDERRYSRASTFNSLTSSSPKHRGAQSLPNRQVDKRIYDPEILKASAQSVPAKTSLPVRVESPVQYRNKPSSLLRIPHLGETIKFDLDMQLEADPAGIIHILTAVKADQKFWMITAAHYKGKKNLDAARKLLEAGIDMAVQSGMETDTKPFWYLLAQNPGNVGVNASGIIEQPRTATPLSHPEFREENLPLHVSNKSQNETKGQRFRYIARNLFKIVDRLDTIADNHPLAPNVFCSESCQPAMFQKASPECEKNHISSDNSVRAVAIKPPASLASSVDNIPTGPRGRVPQPIPYPVTETQNKLSRLQTELGILHEKQNSAIADLSLTRAAKRKAEDDVREERSFRRKLEKELRTVEDALKRSKRMEDAALDQVKREVEARRKAENLLAELRAKREKNLIPSPVPTSDQKPPTPPCSEK